MNTVTLERIQRFIQAELEREEGNEFQVDSVGLRYDPEAESFYCDFYLNRRFPPKELSDG